MKTSRIHLWNIKKYDFIDTLRGIAIMAVVLVHTSQIAPPSSPLLGRICNHGAQGVQLFFLVSAFTLFMSMHERGEREKYSVRNFFIRRIFRVVPLYYLAVLASIVIDGFGPRYWAPDGIKGSYILLNILFLHAWHPYAMTSVVPGGWSIGVEMMFYLLFPFLYRYIRNATRAAVFILVTVLTLPILLSLFVPLVYHAVRHDYIASSFFYLWFFEQLPVFAIGTFVFFIWSRWGRRRDPVRGRILVIASGVLIYGFMDVKTCQFLLNTHLLFGVAFSFLAMGLALHPIKLLVNGVTRWLGKLSYGIYVSHYFIAQFLKPYVKGTGDINTIVWYIVMMIIAAFIALLLHVTVENHGIWLGKKIIQNLETKKGT